MCKMFLSFSIDVIGFSSNEIYWWRRHTSSPFVIYWCWLIFMFKMFHNLNTAFVYLLMLMYFSCAKHIKFLSLFLSFSIDVYVIFLYWNILMKWMHFIFICHLVLLTYFWCGKCFRISILFLIIYWCWLFFMCKMFLSFLMMSMWFSCTETYWGHLLMLTYFCVENVSEFQYCFWIIYWCWLFFHVQNVLIILRVMFMGFSCTETYWGHLLMKWMHFIFICWFSVVDIFLVWKMLTEFQYCFWLFTDVDYFSCAKCSYHFRLMSMWFSCTETYWWSGCTSSSFVI